VRLPASSGHEPYSKFDILKKRRPIVAGWRIGSSGQPILSKKNPRFSIAPTKASTRSLSAAWLPITLLVKYFKIRKAKCDSTISVAMVTYKALNLFAVSDSAISTSCSAGNVHLVRSPTKPKVLERISKSNPMTRAAAAGGGGPRKPCSASPCPFRHKWNGQRVLYYAFDCASHCKKAVWNVPS